MCGQNQAFLWEVHEAGISASPWGTGDQGKVSRESAGDLVTLAALSGEG